MLIQEVFDQLTAGEFSQLSIGGRAAGVIDEENYGAVISHMSLGLTALYKRFNLKEERVTFPLTEGGYTYRLDVADILKVERVLTPDDVELALNDAKNLYSCFTPSLNTIRVPVAIVDGGVDLPDCLKDITELTVVYRANHPKVTKGFAFELTARKSLELPESHLEPLLYFIAARVMTPIGMGQAEGQGGATYFAKYEGACQGLEQAGLQADTQSESTRFQRGGWV